MNKVTKGFTEMLKNPFAIKVYRELALSYRNIGKHKEADAFDDLKREIINGNNSTDNTNAESNSREDLEELDRQS